jgi:hypothetical protein
MFDWEPMHVPETIIQLASDHLIKVDQLPGGVRHEEVKSDLQDSGYEQVGTQGGYDLLVNRDDGRARAVGDGYHVLSIDPQHQEVNLDQKKSDVENVVEAYNSGESRLQADMLDMRERLEIEDTFASSVTDGPGYIMELSSSDLHPLGGAITVNLDEGSKRGIWKFDSEDMAGTVHAIKTNDDHTLTRGFESLEQDGQYLIAEGTYEDVDEGYFTPAPLI